MRVRGLLLLAALCVPLVAMAQGSPDVLAALALTADPARGKVAFEDCSACHRKDAAGRPIAGVPRLAGQHATVIVKQILDIRAGRRLNPAMKAVLDDANPSLQTLADIAAYVEGLPQAAPVTKGPGQALARGQSLYERDCVGCHGAQGEGQAGLFRPMVAAQHYGYVLHELNLIVAGERGNSDPAMAAVLQTYAVADLQAVADYLSQMPPAKR
jgi:cytochrome c553